MKAYALAALLALTSCGNPVGPTPVPSPSPVPSPTPSPEPALGWPTLLKVVGTDFHRHGRKVWMVGYAVCCGPEEPDVNGWPWIDEGLLRDAVAHGVNVVHIRLGPNSPVLEPRAWMRPYVLPDGAWNQEFFARLNALLNTAYGIGAYLEIDLIDGWELKQPDQSAWNADCSILQHAPGATQRAWLNKVVDEIGAHENILWQISNESGKCPPLGTTPEWEEGVARVVKDREALRHFGPHPIATNGEIRKGDMSPLIDYINTHQDAAPELTSAHKPVANNEQNPFPGVARWTQELEDADRNGTIMHLWLSDATATERKQALEVIAEWRRSHP